MLPYCDTALITKLTMLLMRHLFSPNWMKMKNGRWQNQWEQTCFDLEYYFTVYESGVSKSNEDFKYYSTGPNSTGKRCVSDRGLLKEYEISAWTGSGSRSCLERMIELPDRGAFYPCLFLWRGLPYPNRWNVRWDALHKYQIQWDVSWDGWAVPSFMSVNGKRGL